MSQPADPSQAIHAAIAALEAQRAVLGDAVVDTALQTLRDKLPAASPAPQTLQTPPAPSAPPIREGRESLRQVSILFLDAVGSTAVSERLDPEAVSEIMDGLLRRATMIVLAHGGRVLQYAGDNVLAAFGTGQAREDDAEQAVRCGLALLELGREMGRTVGASTGYLGFDVRVGVHSGGVLLGAGVDADGSIRGSAVNIAARMEQSAPPGTLRISQDTYRLAGHAFELEAQPPLMLKGIDVPMPSYLVRRVRPRAFAAPGCGFEGLHTPLVGRTAELATLREWQRQAQSGGHVAGLLVGEAGCGKSRLLAEFERGLPGPPDLHSRPGLTLRGRAVPQTQGQPWGLLRDLLARGLALPEGQSMAAACERFVQAYVPGLEPQLGAEVAQMHAELLGHLVGLDFSHSPHVRGLGEDARQARTRGLLAASLWLGAAAAGRPLVLLLEDLHWADAESLDFIDQLVQSPVAPGQLVLGLTRPELFERRTRGALVGAGSARVQLRLLDAAGSAALADALLQRVSEVPAVLLETLIECAGGNPFYMEELVKMMIDRGAIEVRGERWLPHVERIARADIPPTLTGVLQARLDQLPAHERAALQEASVIGYVFWDQTLLALDTRHGHALPGLEQRQLTHALPALPEQPHREHAFAHKLLHDVAYETLLKRNRRTLHARVAAWLAAQDSAYAAEWLPTTAEHLVLAGDTAAAAATFARAAEHALRRFAHDAAGAQIERALGLLASLPDAQQPALRWRLLTLKCRLLHQRGLHGEQPPVLDELEALARAAPTEFPLSEALCRRADMLARVGPYDQAVSVGREAFDLAQASGQQPTQVLRAGFALLQALTRAGRPGEARELGEQGLAKARELGEPMFVTWYLNGLAMAADALGDRLEFLRLSEQAAAFAHGQGNRRSEALSQINCGVSWLSLGALDEAEAALNQGLKGVRACGDIYLETAALTNLVRCALWRGDAQATLALGRQAIAQAEASKGQQFAAYSLWCMGRAALALGDLAQAEQHFTRSRSIHAAVRAPAQRDSDAALAEVALARGDLAQALKHLDAALAYLADPASQQISTEPYTLLQCWRALHAAGDPRAAPLLARAHTDLERIVAKISDTRLREGFWQRVPEHRAIAEAWQQQTATGVA